MEKILNSIEELYKLTAGTLPEGFVEHILNRYGAIDTRVTSYCIITDILAYDKARIEYGKVGEPTIIDGRIYKYV